MNDISEQYAIHFRKGNELRAAGKPSEAADAFAAAVRLQPDSLPAVSNLATILVLLQRFEEAIEMARRAIHLDRSHPYSYWNLGISLSEMSRFREAEHVFRQAIQLRPQWDEVWLRLGSILVAMGRPYEGLQAFYRALEINPNSNMAHMDIGIAYLTMGEFEKGWPEYEYRFACGNTIEKNYGRPRWTTGMVLPENATILLTCEQGFGDVIQFLRFAPLLKQRGYRVVFHCFPRMMELLSTCPGIDELVPEHELPPYYTVHVPVMSLPGLLGINLLNIPSNVPYLSIAPERIERWRRALQPYSGFKIGVVWQGNPNHGADRHRSMPLSALAPIAQVPGVRLFSLQKNHGAEQLQNNTTPFEIINLASHLDTDENCQRFLDTGAVMHALDLIISIDTATAHLAGALGVPIWLAVSQLCDWRWMRERDDSPWYPTMRIYRQSEPGQWNNVTQRMARHLAAKVTTS